MKRGEDMSDEVIKILDALTERLGLAIDWSSSNVLPYFQQLCNKYIKYEIATSIIWIVIGIVLLLGGRYLFKKRKYINDMFFGANELIITEVIIMVLLGSLMIVTQTFDIATCITFPEKMIFYELQNIYSSYK